MLSTPYLSTFNADRQGLGIDDWTEAQYALAPDVPLFQGNVNALKYHYSDIASYKYYGILYCTQVCKLLLASKRTHLVHSGRTILRLKSQLPFLLYVDENFIITLLEIIILSIRVLHITYGNIDTSP